jgi:arginine decarboxylase
MSASNPQGRPAGASSAELSQLHALPRLRTDTWNRLRDASRRLQFVARRGGGDAEALKAACEAAFELLRWLESYHAFPGRFVLGELEHHFTNGHYEALARQALRVVRLLNTSAYRRLDLATSSVSDYADLLNVTQLSDVVHSSASREQRPYFEVLLVDELSAEEEKQVRSRLRQLRRPDDDFLYEIICVRSFEDALVAALLNFNIESCIVRNIFPFRSSVQMEVLRQIYALLRRSPESYEALMPGERTLELGRALRKLRPELDLFLVTDAPVEDVAGEASQQFRRVFYQQEDYQDLHLSIQKGIHERYESPFFEALRRYSQKPTGMFHALPISRGRTIAKSHWIQDMGRFYGSNIFLAETSATTGGLDSLLQPTGSLRRAQDAAARAFGARRTYFVTNGTSTANKIVLQALVRPGDIVMLAHDCHKSHPYAVILAGAMPIYLDAYPLTEYSMYGGVPLEEIKRQLLALRRAGRLGELRMLLLTNITFDGITYDPLRIMEEVLAIKPDLIFVWDEAWFAYGRFEPTLRQRTAMAATERLRARLRSPEYQQEYRAWREDFDALDPDDDATWLERRLLPDPALARTRVYATHSTHKTLTALRQGSMIHVHDQDFELRVEEMFDEAYMTHTSTSPNYQILASLDVGRRQVELEGYEFVQRSVELAMTLRRRVNSDPKLRRFFRMLDPAQMIPARFRDSKIEEYGPPPSRADLVQEAWRIDEFVLDPTRVTLDVSRTGMDGETFKKLLMDRYDIHVNKTSRNSLLFLIHIGMTRGTIAHLVKVLTQIAQELDDRLEHQSTAQRSAFEARVASLSRALPPLPNFSRFHAAFRVDPQARTPEGDMRGAFFLAYDEAACEFAPLGPELERAVEAGREVVSASFVTPYPPGFPVLVPGQVVSREILAYLRALDVKEIHGFDPEFGLRVFTPEALERRVRAGREAVASVMPQREGGKR